MYVQDKVTERGSCINFVYNGHYILMVLSLNNSLITDEQTVFDYICLHVISYLHFKWMPVDVYIGANEHGMYAVSNLKNISWNRQASNAAFAS